MRQDLTHEDLEKAYQEAAYGKEIPDVGFVSCAKCHRGFMLIRNRENKVCEHLAKIFREKPLLGDGDA